MKEVEVDLADAGRFIHLTYRSFHSVQMWREMSAPKECFAVLMETIERELREGFRKQGIAV